MENSIHAKVNKYVKTWKERCYESGIPDESPAEIEDKVPSYKRIALCLLKNDMNLTGLGFSKSKSYYYDELKKQELEKKGLIKQLSLFRDNF